MPNVVSGLTRMLDCLFLPFVPKETEEELDPEPVLAAKQKLPTLIEPLFFMGLIWSAGASFFRMSAAAPLAFDASPEAAPLFVALPAMMRRTMLACRR